MCYPSEQVLNVAILTSKGIFPKVIFLPPRGKHELNNLKRAVELGISSTMCVPQEHTSKVTSLLINNEFNLKEITMVTPNNITPSHGDKPNQWNPSPLAIPIYQAVQ